ncbi:MAG: hypothetical protein ABIU54_08745, partial [Candidatus Eisenbacteria bacterium]
FAYEIESYVASFRPGYVLARGKDPYAYDDWICITNKDPLISRIQTDCWRVGMDHFRADGSREEGYLKLLALADELRRAADALGAG